MDEDVEEYLLIMSDHLTKIHQRKLNLASNQGKKPNLDGVVSFFFLIFIDLENHLYFLNR